MRPHLKRLGAICGLSIWKVDGERIRSGLHIDFTCGGNEAVYDYVPAGEIWIDDVLGPLDATVTVLHEMVERHLMMTRGWSYSRAHDYASRHERDLRRELRKHRPRTIDLRAAERAYLAYLAKGPGENQQQQLDRELRSLRPRKLRGNQARRVR